MQTTKKRPAAAHVSVRMAAASYMRKPGAAQKPVRKAAAASAASQNNTTGKNGKVVDISKTSFTTTCEKKWPLKYTEQVDLAGIPFTVTTIFRGSYQDNEDGQFHEYWKKTWSVDKSKQLTPEEFQQIKDLAKKLG